MSMHVDRRIDLGALLAKRSSFLFGPRQTGKSTLVRDQLSNARIFNLLESDTYLALQRAPGRLRGWCKERGELVVIDELQKLPPLLDEVHLLIEERKLRSGGVNLLGGRARSLHFHPLCFAELGEHFDLSRALNRGLLPSIYFSDEPDADLSGYVANYVREEIANDAQVARTTVQEYFQILRDTLLGWDVPAWQRTKKRKATATAKFWFFDCGVSLHLRGSGRVRAPSPEFGRAFESWLGHELKTWCDYRGGIELGYWRSQSGHEVDFVLGDEVAIEIKASATIAKQHLAGLAALR